MLETNSKNKLANEYYPQAIEKKWAEIWDKTKPYKVENFSFPDIQRDSEVFCVRLKCAIEIFFFNRIIAFYLCPRK